MRPSGADSSRQDSLRWPNSHAGTTPQLRRDRGGRHSSENGGRSAPRRVLSRTLRLRVPRSRWQSPTEAPSMPSPRLCSTRSRVDLHRPGVHRPASPVGIRFLDGPGSGPARQRRRCWHRDSHAWPRTHTRSTLVGRCHRSCCYGGDPYAGGPLQVADVFHRPAPPTTPTRTPTARAGWPARSPRTTCPYRPTWHEFRPAGPDLPGRPRRTAARALAPHRGTGGGRGVARRCRAGSDGAGALHATAALILGALITIAIVTVAARGLPGPDPAQPEQRRRSRTPAPAGRP